MAINEKEWQNKGLQSERSHTLCWPGGQVDRQEPGIVVNLIILVLKENLKGDDDDVDDKSFMMSTWRKRMVGKAREAMVGARSVALATALVAREAGRVRRGELWRSGQQEKK